jgi:uncharacterized protein (TIGR02147 family)
MITGVDLTDVLQNEFDKRRAKNPRYTLRAFAQNMGVQSATLSAVLKRKRTLPANQIARLIVDLKLSARQKNKIWKSVKTPLQASSLKEFWERPRLAIEPTYEAVISEWKYAAIISLTKIQGFQADEAWIAKRLGLTPARAGDVWTNLLKLKLVQVEAGGNVTTQMQNMRISTPIPSRTVRKAHIQELEIALQKIEEVPLAQRSFSSLTFNMSPKKLSVAKDLIRKFMQQMEDELENGRVVEVYQLGIQLYPLTESEPNA